MKKILLRSLLTSLVIVLAVIYLVKRPAFVWGEPGVLAQQASAERLQQHVRYLSEQLPTRHYQDLAGLNRAADYVATQWQAAGLPVSRQTYEVDGVMYQNIITRIGPVAGERIIIGAHYDAFDDLPGADDNRGNLVMGATGELRELTDADRRICERVGPELRRRGVIFAGLDVIGDYLTEVNVTSPTGIREIHKLSGVNLAASLMDSIEQEITARRTAA